MDADEIADEIAAEAAKLDEEVTAIASRIAKDDFPFAHYGYLMCCMGQLDLMSRCEYGARKSKQTPRMHTFMLNYLDDQKPEEHRVAIQLMRHTLMHTGALRFVYDPRTDIYYTWRIHFGDTFPSEVEHYSVSDVDSAYQDVLLDAVQKPAVTAKALNVRVTTFAADVRRAADKYTTA